MWKINCTLDAHGLCVDSSLPVLSILVGGNERDIITKPYIGESKQKPTDIKNHKFCLTLLLSRDKKTDGYIYKKNTKIRKK